MEIELTGAAGPRGWPEEGCRCASCARAGERPASPLRATIDHVPLESCATRLVPGGRDVRSPEGARVLVADGPGARPEPAEPGTYDAVLLDLIGAPDHLGLLRRIGTVTDRTRVHAIHLDHRIPSPTELDRRLALWLGPQPRRTLVLGGARSGKSEEAELRVAARPEVTYVATAADPGGDREWSARIAAHRVRRPAWWTTVETLDLPAVLADADGTLLIDSIGGWITGLADGIGWVDRWDEAISPRVEELVAAWRDTAAHVVAVSDEAGLSVVPESRVGRVFRDVLGQVNRRLAAESEAAALVVAGRVVELECP
jgi:adenosylcobinamide kinase/adenosylcobinamide-phosphate guanylyltransferase